MDTPTVNGEFHVVSVGTGTEGQVMSVGFESGKKKIRIGPRLDPTTSGSTTLQGKIVLGKWSRKPVDLSYNIVNAAVPIFLTEKKDCMNIMC